MTVDDSKPQEARAGEDPLARFQVLDRLIVGPPKIEARRIVTPYQVVRGDDCQTTELIYRYEESLFDPSSRADRNLASLITAQVALNYGLFAREICFRGSFDKLDQAFLADAAENTAREIAVLKLYQPNPFLGAEFQGLEPTPRSKWCSADLVFEDDSLAAGQGDSEAAKETAATPALQAEVPWRGDPRKICVLSSGGKESLLGFGLMQELGFETHPIFVNESGRHWFTALNAYRHFSRSVPNTARVWTNSDRVFNWMLRHLPFVREDFQDIRADEYPIRLWTVAVFLFGVLPLLRKRGVGCLVVGDEYDTTQRGSYRGIPHYQGLYDQSRFFDRALTRFFSRKGFGLHQCSVLRPLSELLVEKTLAERYPELQRLQVSCHAASSVDDVVRPCGRCEKCRRVVAMLLGLGVDPTLCCYSQEQVDAITATLVDKGVHQEGPAAAHLAMLLAERGVIPVAQLGSVKGAIHREVTRLRFHPERARLDDVPRHIMGPLAELLAQHADGAVTRHGRTWIESNLPMASPIDIQSLEETNRQASTRHALWAELSWPEAKRRLGETDIALLPVGAIEQHGYHLPLDVDTFDADYLAKAVAVACSAPAPLVLPPVPYGVSYHHDSFPGTLSVSNETLSRFCYEIGMAAARNGIRKLIIINGHGGNAATLAFAAQMINRDAHIFTCVDSGETSDTDIDELAETPNDVHAGEIETSTTLALRPELVDMDLAEADVPNFDSQYLDFTSSRSVEWYARTEKISKSGAMGDPTRGDAAKGAEMWKIMIHHLVQLVEHLKPLTLEQIYERRY